MFCPKCGKEVENISQFCPECGNRIIPPNAKKEKETKAQRQPLVNEKRSKKMIAGILGIAAIVLLVMVFIGISGNNNETEHIAMVKNGYLGEYTDATVNEILDNTFNVSGYHLEWTEAELNGKEYVGFHTYLDGETLNDGTTILFQICTDETFKISDYAVSGNGGFERTEIAGDLNFWYMMWYMRNKIGMDVSDEDMMKEMQGLIYNKFDKISGSAVLYGASKDYSGDRVNLCKAIDGSEPLSMSVTELINYYNEDMLDVYTSEMRIDGTSYDNSNEGTPSIGNSEESISGTDSGMEMDYLLWTDDFIRSCGPAASFAIVSIDEKGIMFTAGIGASGYLAYLDMRGFEAGWIDEHTAVYIEESGYKLTITLNDDGSITLDDNQPYYGGLGLAGLYTRVSEAVYPDCEFVFAHSSYAYISSRECEGLNEAECKIARNEIYARHGRKFDDESLQAYFDICSWYEGILEPEDFAEEMLNEYEVENLKTIVQYEEDMGYR